jgi:hypothetical protein
MAQDACHIFETDRHTARSWSVVRGSEMHKNGATLTWHDGIVIVPEDDEDVI